jgi:hypothetical protein
MKLDPKKLAQIAITLIIGCMTTHLFAVTKSKIENIQTSLETSIREFLSTQLKPNEYLVYAIVTDSGASKSAEATTLPYISLKIDQRVLDEIFSENQDVAVDVNIVFDSDVPSEKQTLLKTVIEARFGFGTEKRKLTVQSVKIASIDPASAAANATGNKPGEAGNRSAEEILAIEKARMESELSKVKMEAERAKLDLKKQEIELIQKNQPNPNPTTKPEEAIDPSKNPGASTSTTIQQPANVLKDFQLAGVALVLAIVILVGIMLAGKTYVKAMSPLSTALTSVGSSIETAFKSASASSGGGGRSSSASTEKEAHAGSSSVSAGAVVSHAGGGDSQSQEEAHAFAEMIQQKVKVLLEEKSYNFFRVFIDLLTEDETLPFAASILVSIDAGSTTAIINGLSAENIARLQGFLSAEGGLLRARDLKQKALSMFYGKIAMDEFVGTPLMQLKDLSWLTKMTNVEMANFAVKLSDTDRATFMACLSPERMKFLIDAIQDPTQRTKLLQSIAGVRNVTDEEIAPFIKEISKTMVDPKETGKGPRKAVNGAKFVAQVASSLVESDQAKIYELIDADKEFVSNLKQHYVPFRVVKDLSQQIIKEIFGNLSDNEIAKTIFDS